MALIFILLLFALSLWSLIALFRRLRRVHAGMRLWSSFAVLILVGAAVGFWCSFYCEYHTRENYRIASFPIPIVFFHLEEGNWVDFPVPDYQVWPTAITNILIIPALATSPLWIFSKQRRSPGN
jgi:hypothetical protein